MRFIPAVSAVQIRSPLPNLIGKFEVISLQLSNLYGPMVSRLFLGGWLKPIGKQVASDLLKLTTFAKLGLESGTRYKKQI